jgi:hypothetical protein
MITGERIHSYCQNVDTANYISNDMRLNDTQIVMQRPIIEDQYANTHYYVQNQLNDEIKNNSIILSTSYWNNVFESIKLVNRYWSKIFNIGINNSSIV